MKTLKVFFVLLFVACIAVSTVNAQAVVVKDQNWYGIGYVSYDAHEVLTPDGTINLRVNFKFDLTHPMIIQAIMYGKYTLTGIAYGNNGEIPYVATIYPNGSVKLIGHRLP